MLVLYLAHSMWPTVRRQCQRKQPVWRLQTSKRRRNISCKSRYCIFVSFPVWLGRNILNCAWLWWQIQLAVAAARRVWQGEQQPVTDMAVQNALRLEREKACQKLEREKSSWNKEREWLCSQVELLKDQQRTSEFFLQIVPF